MCPDWIFLKDVEGKLCLLFDFSWTDIDCFTFQVSPNEITNLNNAQNITLHIFNFFFCSPGR